MFVSFEARKYMKQYILNRLAVILLTISIGFSAFSQDVHFSQFDAAPLFFNPAQTGLFDCHQRIIANVKGQWSTYNSFMASYDRPLSLFSTPTGYFGAGALVIADYAGETSYGNTLLKLMPAYHQNVMNSRLKLSIGLDIFMNYMSIDETKVLLGSGIDPNTGKVTPGADFDNSSKFYADLGVGTNAIYHIQPDFPISGGITMYRLFGSGGGGIASNEAQTNYRRFSINANSVIPVTEVISFLPSLIYLNQKKYNEINFGTYAMFSVGERTSVVDALYVGAWHRYGDAIILGFAFDKTLSAKWAMNFGFSYDITVSQFRATNKWQNTKNVGTDSFEFSIKFINCKIPLIVNPQGIINDPFR